MFLVTGEIWTISAGAASNHARLALALAIGIPLGLAAGWYRRFNYAVEPFLTALNATPQVAFLPLLIVWVGTGLASRVLIIVLLAVLPIAISALPPYVPLMCACFASREVFRRRRAAVPQHHPASAVPFLLAGLRLAVGRAMIGIVVGEIYGSAAGIGMMINHAGSRFETDKVFVGVLTIAAAGVALVEIIRRIEQRVEVWRPRVRHDPKTRGAGHPAGISSRVPIRGSSRSTASISK